MKMHADQIPTDAGLVRRLLRAQFPQWADLDIAPVEHDGTAHAIYRLGADLAVRLPLLQSPTKVEQIEKEHAWLPRFAAHLPLDIPLPIAKGAAAEGYPGPWTVCTWLSGEPVSHLDDPAPLAAFIHALQRLDATGGPAPGAHNFGRGVPLAERDAPMRAALARCEGLLDVAAVTAAWDAGRDAPAWERPPVWVHGDLLPGNLLAHDGRLTGVIDWGGLGVGDPAVELLPAWVFFAGADRDTFRAALACDDAMWARGRGWALSQAVIALPYYLETNPGIVRRARSMIDAVLADHAA